MSALVGRAQHAAGNVSHQLQHVAGNVGHQLQTTGNRLLPPQQREKAAKDLHKFSNANPKLASFLAIQTLLTGIPIFLFLAFAVSTLLISMSTCLLVAVTTALTYTFFAVGTALLLLIPTLFFASCAATCMFLWGLVIYMVLRLFHKGEQQVKRAQDTSSANGIDVSRGAGNASLPGGDGRLGRIGEWENKWIDGFQRKEVEFTKTVNVKTDPVPITTTL